MNSLSICACLMPPPAVIGTYLQLPHEDHLALQYASEQLRDDYDIVHRAVLQSGYALKYASAELQGNREIVKEAVSQDLASAWHTSDWLCQAATRCACRGEHDAVRVNQQCG